MKQARDRLGHAIGTLADRTLARAVEAAASDPKLAPVFDGILAGSPFLAECVQREPDLVARFHTEGPDALASDLTAELAAVDRNDRTRLMSSLRRCRRRHALVIALADLTGAWPLERVTAALTGLADRAVALAVDHLLLEAVRRGELAPADPAEPAVGSGLIVLGMGKLGAGELNYSSDIDLIVLFDEEAMPYRGAEAPMALAVRLARSLAFLLESRTRDGFVFRTDLRLRPHLPGHPLAISTEAAELYYERHGQNWERAALIKARAMAGDVPAGERFLRLIAPFIWRKHLDYAAIRDIHSIKRQINAFRGFSAVRVRGHDLKVGRGGIREIEFFAQTQQLILGGRFRELRDPRTLAALEALGQGRWVDETTARELSEAYRLLRALEHRLQMVADKQTQTLPERERELEQFAAFAGFPSVEAFEDAARAAFMTVERHYAGLFEAEADLGAGGSLVFTGTADDPDTLENLRKLGFKDPAPVSARLRAWHHGHIRATRSTRARELLTELTPGLFEALSQQGDADEAFRRFDELVTSLPAGVQLFSLFRANLKLLNLLADLMGTAPRLARHLSSNVDLFDAMLSPDFFDRLPGAEALASELKQRLHDARDLQDTLDICRRWAHGRQFQAGLQVLLGASDAALGCRTLTAIAEIVIGSLLPTAEAWLVSQHGRIKGGTFVVLGLGKLGAGELTAGSDLDLVFVYDAPRDSRSDGARSLPAHTFYARLSQRVVSAITAQTSEGRLYEIDTRLRPSGNAGPVATSLENFARYHEGTAQTWELQALTRARVVAGDPGLAARTEAAIWNNLARSRDSAALAGEVRAMRERIFKEHGQDDPWALKQARGGIVELEFIVQHLKLAHAHTEPALRTTDTRELLRVCGEQELLAADQTEALQRAHALFQGLQAVLRLSLSERFDLEKAPEPLPAALVKAAGLALSGERPPESFAGLEQQLVESQAAVQRIFAALCPPASEQPTDEREGDAQGR